MMGGQKRQTRTRRSDYASAARRTKHGWIWTVIFSVLTLLWVSPLLIVLLNSFKRKAFIFKNPFSISRYSLIADGFEKWQKGIEKAFFGLQNYTNGIQRTNFWSAFGCSLFITVLSVAAILLFCSMTAWFVVRVHTVYTKLFYVLCLFSMIVPFQMVMFTLTFTADQLKLNTPWTIPVVYLGFGAGLAIFMFVGFVKSIPLEIEESAAIDG
jgi:raffinose/stachyose/melibiose transport system permease protein